MIPALRACLGGEQHISTPEIQPELLTCRPSDSYPFFKFFSKLEEDANYLSAENLLFQIVGQECIEQETTFVKNRPSFGKFYFPFNSIREVRLNDAKIIFNEDTTSLTTFIKEGNQDKNKNLNFFFTINVEKQIWARTPFLNVLMDNSKNRNDWKEFLITQDGSITFGRKEMIPESISIKSGFYDVMTGKHFSGLRSDCNSVCMNRLFLIPVTKNVENFMIGFDGSQTEFLQYIIQVSMEYLKVSIPLKNLVNVVSSFDYYCDENRRWCKHFCEREIKTTASEIQRGVEKEISLCPSRFVWKFVDQVGSSVILYLETLGSLQITAPILFAATISQEIIFQTLASAGLNAYYSRKGASNIALPNLISCSLFDLVNRISLYPRILTDFKSLKQITGNHLKAKDLRRRRFKQRTELQNVVCNAMSQEKSSKTLLLDIRIQGSPSYVNVKMELQNLILKYLMLPFVLPQNVITEVKKQQNSRRLTAPLPVVVPLASVFSSWRSSRIYMTMIDEYLSIRNFNMFEEYNARKYITLMNLLNSVTKTPNTQTDMKLQRETLIAILYFEFKALTDKLSKKTNEELAAYGIFPENPYKETALSAFVDEEQFKYLSISNDIFELFYDKNKRYGGRYGQETLTRTDKQNYFRSVFLYDMYVYFIDKYPDNTPSLRFLGKRWFWNQADVNGTTYDDILISTCEITENRKKSLTNAYKTPEKIVEQMCKQLILLLYVYANIDQYAHSDEEVDFVGDSLDLYFDPSYLGASSPNPV